MVFIDSVLILVISFHLSMQNIVPHVDFNAETDTIYFQNCFVEDLRNIREYNKNPLEVAVNHCYLQELPNALFIRFRELKTLEICDSRVNNLQDYALNGLKGLEILNLSRNNLTVIKSWSDHDLEKLNTLDLRRNLIKDLNKNSFKRYPNLTKLNLAVNLIEVIAESTFTYVPHLKYLNLGKNFLTDIDETMLKGLHKLTHLSLHHNNIKHIDFFAFVGNSHLKTLHLQDNEITVFETDLLSNLPRLAYFNISHNSLDNLNENTFKKNTDLKILDISYNQLISFAEDTFKGLESLEIFNSSHNHLEKLNKYVMKDFLNVRHLDFSGNNLTHISNNLFEYTTKIEKLNLSRNHIDEIEQNSFKEVKKLKSLDLSHNELSADSFMWPIIGLKYLNLSHNQFKSLNTSVLEDLLDVKLFENPWECKFLVLEMMDFWQNIHFGSDYKVESHANILNVPGVECTDESGSKRSIIVLEKPEKEDYSINDVLTEHKLLSKYSAAKSINDDFDYKSTIVWLAIGVVVVFGAVKIITIFLQKSEKQSEQWHVSQRTEFLPVEQQDEIKEKHHSIQNDDQQQRI